MGDAFITRRGGGVKEGYALIAVTYPVGSVCTCTNGTKTLSAEDTSGAFLFVIPEAGTWTVSCTDGTQTTSNVVVVSSQYQFEDVSLVYREYIIQDGILLYPTILNYTTTTKENDYLKITQTHTNHCYFNAGPVDLTNYSTLYFQTKEGKTEVFYFGSSYGGCGFGVSNVAISSISYNAGTRLSSGYSGKTLSCDVSSLSGEYYVSCDFEGSANGTQILYVTNFWFE